MSRFRGRKRRIAVFVTLFLALISSSLVVAHQCHSNSSEVNSIQVAKSPDTGFASIAPEKSTHIHEGTSKGLIDSGCAALIVVVLILGRKYLLDRKQTLYPIGPEFFSRMKFPKLTSQLFQHALSLPQLGVIRI